MLTICVGKSTYARCFSGDTRVALVDGSEPTLEELADRHANAGEMFWGYAIGPYGRIIVALLDAPRHIGSDPLLEIRLDNEELIRCTPDHEFVRRDGRMVRAADLRPEDSLMPLYRQHVRGYEAVYQPLNGHIYPTHRLADEWNIQYGIYADEPGTHRHHKDHDRLNNNPWNLERMPASDHIRLHNEDTFGEDFDGEVHGKRIREGLNRRAQDPVWRARFSHVQRERTLRFWTEERYAEARELLRQKRIASWTQHRRDLQADIMRVFYMDKGEREAQGARQRKSWERDDGSRRERQRDVARRIRLREEIDEAAVRSAIERAGTIRGAARLLGCDRSVFRRFPDVLAERVPKARNHRVKSVRSLSGVHDVYCLTVPEAGNFALAAGVFTRNCGLIVNVTPFEPEWEGHVTLEISNTTPLPAKIYANEGIAQVLFFESDDPPETSYADRGGKYQAQRGVTLPKL
ncbi:MAG TPA: dCTP deaminase [Gemmatimonadota bacterium]|nr:dCTP deaminase [Gemmatimonadota bacterium]